ncbi:hypothetical protein K435DRAFT_808243 [Dendrothele bispora CBS 962.96]|uniref:Uncharacterized protein n=1 Tax=Dendrothele bispora (strain CBS 962.96) TaxID=1314807 RepID=A0A4S8L252_DENBC|nr:hypothetical protein K435DRAFT_808243 [Dendrothele bispora CBS 962.96]
MLTILFTVSTYDAGLSLDFLLGPIAVSNQLQVDRALLKTQKPSARSAVLYATSVMEEKERLVIILLQIHTFSTPQKLNAPPYRVQGTFKGNYGTRSGDTKGSPNPRPTTQVQDERNRELRETKQQRLEAERKEEQKREEKKKEEQKKKEEAEKEKEKEKERKKKEEEEKKKKKKKKEEEEEKNQK